jgi:acyl carrier protein
MEIDMKSEFAADKTRAEVILTEIIHILEDMTYDWDMDFDDPLGPETRLIKDLEFGSIDVVQFVVAIEEKFQRRGLPWEEFLMVEGRYVDEIKVGDTVDFLYRCLNNHSKGT